MSNKLHIFALQTAFVIGTSIFTTPLFAAAADYQFTLVEATAAGPKATDVTVMLAHLPDSSAVSGAVIYKTKADMGPSGMAEMPGKTFKARVGTTSGTYVVRVETPMKGTWALTLLAKVQGESETVQSTLDFEVE